MVGKKIEIMCKERWLPSKWAKGVVPPSPLGLWLMPASFSWSSSSLSISSPFPHFPAHHHQHHHSSHLFLIIIINILNMISLIFCHFLLRLSSPSLPPHWSLTHEKSWSAVIFFILLILVFSVIIIISTTHSPMNNHNWRHWMSSLADQEGSQRQSNCW